MKIETGPLLADKKLAHPDGIRAVEITKRHMNALHDELKAEGLLSWVPVRTEHALVDVTPPDGTWRSYAPSGAIEFVIEAGLRRIGARRYILCDDE